MELLKKNQFDTSTSIAVGSATGTAAYIMERDTSFQYVTEGFNDDLTTASLTINFSETTTISRIALMGINLKSFDIYYNGATANTFALTSTGATTVSQWSSNSETAMYLQATPVDCTSVTIDMKTTQVANSEKAIGYLLLTEEHVNFDRLPAAKDYKPKVLPKEVVHALSDGSTRIQTIDQKFQCQIKLSYVSESFRNSLKTVYDLHDGMVFAAFGTTTAWDEVLFPCVWSGPFEFYTYSDNAPSAGFEGTIMLQETTPT